MEIVVRELNIAWQPVGLKFALERREPGAEVSRLMPLSEKTLCMSFEIRMPEVQGTLNLCLPAVVLNTILRRLIAERDRPRRRSVGGAREDGQSDGGGPVWRCAPVSNHALERAGPGGLAPGAVLRLPLPRQAVAELRVGGLAIFHAQPVRSGEHRGAQVKGHTVDAQRPGVQ